MWGWDPKAVGEVEARAARRQSGSDDVDGDGDGDPSPAFLASSAAASSSKALSRRRLAAAASSKALSRRRLAAAATWPRPASFTFALFDICATSPAVPKLSNLRRWDTELTASWMLLGSALNPSLRIRRFSTVVNCSSVKSSSGALWTGRSPPSSHKRVARTFP